MDRRTLLAGAAVSATLPFIPCPAEAAGTPMILGAQTHFSQGLSKLGVFAQARAAKLPITFVRDEMFWRRVEKSPGVLDSSEYDAYASAAQAQGFKILLELFNVNPLYDGGKFPASDAAQDAFARYAAYLVQRYGNNLQAVELWNEPNGSFGYGYSSTDLAPIYTRLAQKVYAAVKAVRTDIPVLVGASVLFAVSWHQKLINAGILPYCDGFSFHPYVYPDRDDVSVPMKQLRALIPSTKSLWATEWGVNRHDGMGTPINHIRKLGCIMAANGVRGSSYYILQDTPPNLATRGLLDVNGAKTDQGIRFTEMYTKMWRGGSVKRGSGSALVPNYIGNLGYQCAWIQADPGRGTLGGVPLDTSATHIPSLRSGTFVETTPR